MAVQYTTIAAVKKIAEAFSPDFRQGNPDLDSDISEIIDEATGIAKSLLQTRFDLDTIDSNPPKDAKRFTAIKAAMILLSQKGLVSGGTNQKLLDRLKVRLQFYKKLIVNGSLLDIANMPIPSTQIVAVGGFSGPEAFQALFEGGPRGS